MNGKLFLFCVCIMVFLNIETFPQTDVNSFNLMPAPVKISYSEGKYRITKDFTVAIKGNSSERLYNASARTVQRLSGRTGLFFPEFSGAKSDNASSASMIIETDKTGALVLNEDESYSLDVSAQNVSLKAKTDIGALRGLETLLQLLGADENGYFFPTVKIEDSPRFPWRGLMIDASRHFMPVEVIKRNIDGLAAVKMNVLHLHLSDNQGVRVESKIYPQLQKLASDGNYYTQEQIKEIVAYAAERGIRVIPEFDIPWHSTAWFAALPELASGSGPYKIERKWGVFDPVFNPSKDATYEFFDKFFGEMTALFPDEYFHIGGDEGTKVEWTANKDIQEFMKKNNLSGIHAMHSYFNLRILKVLTKYNKKMIGWDEILMPEMPTSIVIQSWRGQKSLFESAKKGYMGILSNGYYIDLIQPTDFHYLNDPLPDTIKLTAEEKSRILGGEATMWAELVTPETVDSRIWPRTAAIAERFWSPSSVKDVKSMYARLDRVSVQLEELGLTHIKNQEMMLRRLTNNNDTKALKTLVDVIEPVKLYTRHSLGVKYTSYSPYTRVVDAALPDAKIARDFRNDVDDYLLSSKNNTEELNKLKDQLLIWKNNDAELQKVIKKSPILNEISDLSKELTEVSEIGLQAIDMIINKKKPEANWFIVQMGTLKKDGSISFGQSELMIVTAVEKLFAAANNFGQN
jgi:hexosaminidase